MTETQIDFTIFYSWQSDLPEAFAVGLEPYRERLEATYSRAANPFELVEFE